MVLHVGIDIFLCAEHMEVWMHCQSVNGADMDIGCIPVINLCLLDPWKLLQVKPWAFLLNILEQMLDILLNWVESP
jgi:hypothetical protein